MKAWMMAAVMAGAAMALSGCGSEPSPEQQVETATAGVCVTHLRRQLNDPGSLSWDYSTTNFVHHDEGVTLNRVFTAKNALGGTVRNTMQCTYDPDAQRIVAFDIF